MERPTGKRDGDFIYFEDWDIPGHPVAYYPELQGQGSLDKLKDIILSKRDSLYCGFNTWGWMKAWTMFDWSMFKHVPGCTLYVRVQFPGWCFVQGKDSNGNDIKRITDASAPVALMSRIEEIWKEDEANDRIAAFNTEGWVKRVVKFPLTPGPNPSDISSLDGIYIRTDFRDFKFFPQRDSDGNDIRKEASSADDIPALIRSCKSTSNSAGFNTAGWIKKMIQIPPPDSAYNSPWQGTFFRIHWPDFIFLPGLDSPGNDLRQLRGRPVLSLVQAARDDAQVVAFNTSGWMKSSLNDEPSEWPSSFRVNISVTDEYNGIYVKISHPDSSKFLEIALFSMKGTVVVFSQWFINDAKVRESYRVAVKTACNEILQQVRDGTLRPEQAALDAVEVRNQHLYKMRTRSSPVGLKIAEYIKPAGGTYLDYLNKYAIKQYGKPFAQLTAEEAESVAVATVEAASRANPGVTKLITRVGQLSKALLVVGAAMSMYSVVVADDWKREMMEQVGWWTGAIAGGKIGVGVGALFGPAGAIMGGIAGGILGGLGLSKLAGWFYGAVTNKAATEILVQVSLIEIMRSHVQDRLARSGKNFYVHRVFAAQLSRSQSEGAALDSVALEMIESSAMIDTDEEAVATIVWVKSGRDLLPNNAANPKDMVTLLDWVACNLPKSCRVCGMPYQYGLHSQH